MIHPSGLQLGPVRPHSGFRVQDEGVRRASSPVRISTDSDHAEIDAKDDFLKINLFVQKLWDTEINNTKFYILLTNVSIKRCVSDQNTWGGGVLMSSIEYFLLLNLVMSGIIFGICNPIRFKS